MTTYGEALLFQLESTLPPDWLQRVYQARAAITDSNAFYRQETGFLLGSRPMAVDVPWLISSIADRDPQFTHLVREIAASGHYAPRRKSLVLGCPPQGDPKHGVVEEFVASVFGQDEGDGTTSLRSYASAGGLYPVQVLLGVRRGNGDGAVWAVSHYIPSANGIEDLVDITSADMANFVGQMDEFNPLWSDFFIAYVVIPAVVAAKYGPRGYKFALLEVGAMQESVRRAADMKGWGSRCYGYYDELGISDLFGLNADRVWIDGVQFVSLGG